MGKKKTSGSRDGIGHVNLVTNKERRIKAEIKQCEKKMEKLLKLYKDGRQRHCGDKVRKIQGMASGSKRHKALQSYIAKLKDKV